MEGGFSLYEGVKDHRIGVKSSAFGENYGWFGCLRTGFRDRVSAAGRAARGISSCVSIRV